MPYRWCAFGLTLFGDPHQSIRIPLRVRLRMEQDRCVVAWNSWVGRTYSVHRSTEPFGERGVCLASNLVATPPLNVWTNSVADLPQAFYRIQTPSP